MRKNLKAYHKKICKKYNDINDLLSIKNFQQFNLSIFIYDYVFFILINKEKYLIKKEISGLGKLMQIYFN